MDVKDLLNTIYSRLDRAALVSDLHPQDRGGYYEMTCPQCGERTAYLYNNGITIKCNRLSNCNYSKSLWDYLQETRGLSNNEVLQELAKFANYELPTLDEQAHDRAARSRERINIMETALAYFQAQLWEVQGQDTLTYLKDGRSYSEPDIKVMELGHYPGQAATEDYLTSKGYSTKDIENVLKWYKSREDYKLVIPYRDQVGRLTGLYGRLTRTLETGEKESDKYKPFTEAAGVRDIPLNLDKAKRADTIIIVEGLLDTLISQAKGITGTVATGQANLTDNQIDALVKAGVKYFILCMDNDPAGEQGTEAAIRKLNAKGLPAFVVTLPEGYKDPDALIKGEGAEALRQLTGKPQAASRWMARRLLSRYDIGQDIGQQQAIDAAIEYANSIQDPLEGKQFMETVCQELSIPYEALAPRIMDYNERQAREQEKKDYKDLIVKADQLHRDNKIGDLKALLIDNLKDIKAQAGAARALAPYTVADMVTDVKQTSPGLNTGYASLDKIITIPQEAVTIIAGRPSHGKTTLMLNLLLKMVEIYKDKTFILFSYEETRKQIALKLLNILSQDVINEAQNLSQIENYIRGGNASREQLEEGKRKLADLTSSGRLWIIDEPFFINDLEGVIANLASKHQLGAIFIDYIQKIKIHGKYGTRQLELQAISAQLLEIAKENSLPLILGAQLGRNQQSRDKVQLDNLREAGDIEQDANLVIGLYNEAMQKAQDEDKKLIDRAVNIDLVILKNRNGTVNEKVTLRFDRPILNIRELNLEKNGPAGTI